MSIFHLTVKRGSRSENRLSVAKHDYIMRLGRFAERHDGELTHAESGNMPAWAEDDPRQFWDLSDVRERANATLYHEIEFALPRELTQAQQIEAARELARLICGDLHPYSWGLHDKVGNPHVHLMFSGRVLDGIERNADQFFKRYNSKTPEKGGCRKESSGEARGPEWVSSVRENWQEIANHRLATGGHETRIDHRSNKARGIDEAPGVHLGRKVHRLEKAGKATWRGNKNREAAYLNASLRGVRTQIHEKENFNGKHSGRSGTSQQRATCASADKTRKSQQHHAGTAGARAQRAFTAWRNGGEDRPGLRASQLGPQRMPALRDTRLGHGQPEPRDTLLQRSIPGYRDGNHRLHSVPAGGGLYVVEALDRRQLYKAKLLQERYQQEIHAALAAKLAYVDRRPDHIAITLKGGGGVVDHGDRLLTMSGRDREITAVIALAQAKGWTKINLSGTAEFQARAWLEAARAGLDVVGYEPPANLRAQLQREKTMLGQAGSAVTPDSYPPISSSSNRWLEPLQAAAKKLRQELLALKAKLEQSAESDLKKLKAELAERHGGQEYRQARADLREAEAAADSAGALTRWHAEAKAAKASERFKAIRKMALNTPAAAQAIRLAMQQQQDRDALESKMVSLKLGFGHINYWIEQVESRKLNPEAEFGNAWQRRKAKPLARWEELVMTPVFGADEQRERDRMQAEAEAVEQVRQIQRRAQAEKEIAAQQKADAIDDRLSKPGLTTEQEENLQEQRAYFQALADGRTEEEAKEFAAKKSNASRPH